MTIPRLAGTIPKLLPRASWPAIVIERPIAETNVVTRSGNSPAPGAARTISGPTADIAVATTETGERSTTWAGRLATVKTMTRDSAARRRRPVIRPVCRKSPSRTRTKTRYRPVRTARAIRSPTDRRVSFCFTAHSVDQMTRLLPGRAMGRQGNTPDTHRPTVRG